MYDDDRSPTGEAYGYDKRHGRGPHSPAAVGSCLAATAPWKRGHLVPNAPRDGLATGSAVIAKGGLPLAAQQFCVLDPCGGSDPLRTNQVIAKRQLVQSQLAGSALTIGQESL